MEIEIDLENVTWDYVSHRAWNDDRLNILELDVEDGDNLDKIARFFAKTVDKITKSLAYGQKLQIDLFSGIR